MSAVVICPGCLRVRRVPNHERAYPWHRKCRERAFSCRKSRAAAR